MALPPDVSASDFDAALRVWREAVGPDWVFTTDEDVALYRDAYSPFWGEPEERVASAAVAPQTLEQVQAVVRIANQYSIPLYAISTGRNLALRRLRARVLRQRGARSQAHEPGARGERAQRLCAGRAGRQLLRPVRAHHEGEPRRVDRSARSGLGQRDRQCARWRRRLDGLSPFRDHFGSHCGMEVVLASGEVVRTGMGALPNSKTWQHNRWGYGPWVDGLFRQGNIGVVTKMGFYLMPRPEALQTPPCR